MGRINYDLSHGHVLNIEVKNMTVEELADFLSGFVMALPDVARNRMFQEWKNYLNGAKMPPLSAAIENLVRRAMNTPARGSSPDIIVPGLTLDEIIRRNS